MLVDDLQSPKFLTEELVMTAIHHVVSSVFESDIGRMMKRQMLHVVVIVPGKEINSEKLDSDYFFTQKIYPLVLAEASFGENWPYAFDGIARSKALQLWENRNDDRTDVQPHLLFGGESPYWGGVKRHDIVVSSSGVEPHFDKMISGMIADMIVGLSYHAWMMSEDKENDVEFLTLPPVNKCLN